MGSKATTGPVVALAGNPNAGKSTIFNTLTGGRQHVGNWPGKTVDVASGTVRCNGTAVTLVDLPGTYSLSAHSLEEVIARDFILEERPDAAIVVADATNLERNLYLAAQVLELGVPVALALNMIDRAEAEGIAIDVDLLSRLLGVPVVPTVGTRRQGLLELVGLAVSEAAPRPNLIDYGVELEQEIAALEGQVALFNPDAPRYATLKLLEGDNLAVQALGNGPAADALRHPAQQAAARVQAIYGDDVQLLVADRRYGFVHGLAQQVVKRRGGQQRSLTDRIDDVVAHRVLGLPIFFLLMALVFKLTADASAPFVDWIDSTINVLTGWVTAGLTAVAAPAWLISLLVDGVMAGVGGVLMFLPVLLILYFCLALLEDSGYMARAAFVMDRLMHVLGLHGKSFIPLIVGFGCNVPGILATRTLENRRDRILTGLMVPLMSCAARLPVYVIFAAAFFPQRASAVIFGLYVLGIVLAVLTGLLMRRTLFGKTQDSLFVLELPPYRLPAWRGLRTHMWRHSEEFVRKAATLILAAAVIVWVLLNLPIGVENTEDSLFGRAAGAVAPLFEPLGFGNWQATGSLATGLVAKEVVVSSMAVIYLGDEPAEPPEAVDVAADVRDIVVGFAQAVADSVRIVLSMIPGVDLMGDEPAQANTALSQALQANFTPASALAFLVFVLLYAPCVAAMGALKAEFGTRWMVFSFFYLLALAWIAGLVTYLVAGWLLG